MIRPIDRLPKKLFSTDATLLALLFCLSPLFGKSQLPQATPDENSVTSVTIPGSTDRMFFRLRKRILSPARLESLDHAGWVSQEVRPGLLFYEHHFDDLDGSPQIIQILALSLDKSNLRFELTATDVWGWKRMTIPKFAERAGAVAAINGGFAPGNNFPEVGYGMMKFRGKVWPFVNDTSFHSEAEANGRNALGIDAQGRWHFRSRGTEGWETGTSWPADWEEMTDVMAGGSLLLQSGEIHPLILSDSTQGAYLTNSDLQRRTFNRHPRSAIGITDNRVAVLVNVVGRFRGKAAGMTLSELARFLKFAGCQEAMELDGGGSTTMWIGDEPYSGVVNYPTDNRIFDHEGARSLRLGVFVMERTKSGYPE